MRVTSIEWFSELDRDTQVVIQLEHISRADDLEQ